MGKPKFIYMLAIPVALAADYFIISWSLHNQKLLNLSKLFQTTSLLTIENKLDLFSRVFYFLAIYSLIFTILVMSYRILTGRQPVNKKGEDWPLVQTFNRIIANTIQQSFIFFSLYFYWIQQKYVNDTKLNEAILYPFLFLLARVMFAIGYIAGTITSVPIFRSPGFAMNLTVVFILLLQINNISIWKYF